MRPTFLSVVISAFCVLTVHNSFGQPASAPVSSSTTATNSAGRSGVGRRGGSTDWAARMAADFNDLKVFTNANAKLPPPAPGEDRVVFIGDSITAGWQGQAGNFIPRGGTESCFPGKTNYIGRGYTSETTQQMLVRFRQDILDLRPKVVVIMAGVNDVAGNTGEYRQKVTEDCFKSMFDLAEFNHMKVVLVSTLPCDTFFWQRSITDGAEKVFSLVNWERDYCAKRGIEFVDAYTLMADENHHMKPGLSSDTVHPTAQGYYLLSKPVGEAIERVLAKEKQSH